MTDPLRDVASDRKAKRENFLAGRASRKEYWIYVAVVFVTFTALSLIGYNSSSAAGAGVLLMINIRRFHDFGLSGWWALALLVGQFLLAFPMVMLGEIGLVLSGVVGLAVVAALGAIPGQPGENRFGAPRGQRKLSEIFR